MEQMCESLLLQNVIHIWETASSMEQQGMLKQADNGQSTRWLKELGHEEQQKGLK